MLRVLLCAGLALGVSVVAQAQMPPSPAAGVATVAPANPYSATVPVAGTSDAQRSAAIAAALTQVLQQVSPGFTPSADMLANASGYVRNYHYRRAASGAGLELQVDFDPGSVGRLTAQGGGASPAAPGATASTGAAAGQAAVGPTGAATRGSGTLWVGGIDSSHAFASLLALLRGDAQLDKVVPVAADADGVLLQVDYNAPLATVVAALEAPNGHLAQAVQAHAGADASLHWIP
ncbi:MAG TPA: DUF2066 domain-containing protein [Rhodanobacteraceae bacterium]|nr:DUF2066 domain-containing protein [Rhodanobacteraceae bacterium]